MYLTELTSLLGCWQLGTSSIIQPPRNLFYNLWQAINMCLVVSVRVMFS